MVNAAFAIKFRPRKMAPKTADMTI